jgi:hypothetical protein
VPHVANNLSMSSTALRRLTREWYARLAAEGFDDLEYGRENGPLKVSGGRENRGIDALQLESTREYFSRASEYLEANEWTDATLRGVWSLHCDGATLREVAKAYGRSRHWAQDRVDAIKAEMTEWREGHEGHASAPRRRWGRQRRSARPPVEGQTFIVWPE